MAGESDSARVSGRAAGIVLGVFAGGRGTRMGGVDKGALPAPGSGEPLRSRLVRVGRKAGCEVVIVGGPSGALPDVPVLADQPSGLGPLGGLGALLAWAGARPAIALACDMPYVTAALLGRLAVPARAGAVIAPRDRETGKWQPLFARYDSVRVLPVLRGAVERGVRSFQELFGLLDVEELALAVEEYALLRDWDEPGDVEGG